MTDQPQTVAAAKQPFCHTSLNLVLDGSQSLSLENWQKQVHATADAITHPNVLKAMLRSNGAVAIRAGKFAPTHTPLVGWHVIESPADAEVFANALRAHANIHNSDLGSNIGGALLAAVAEMSTTPCPRSHGIIDISTDGLANKFGQKDDLSPPEKMAAAKAAAAQAHITINGIAIGGGVTANYLRLHVITRDGFAKDAEWDNYAEIIRRKIEIEVGNNQTRPDDGMRFASSDESPDGMPLPTQLLQSQSSLRLP